MLFREYSFLDRFDRAAEAGFEGVEFFFPYGHDPADISAAISRNNLTLVLFNLPVGDFDSGERGFVAVPERAEEFRSGVSDGVRYGKSLSPQKINTPSGPAPDSAASLDVLVENIDFATVELEQIGVGMVIEPINQSDVPGALISTTPRAAELVERVGRPNLGIQYDVYHSAMAGEDPVQMLGDHLDLIHHIQVGDVPGRHQPGTGALDFDRIVATVDKHDYDGWVSLEYHPEGATEDSFDYFRDRGLLT